VGGSVFYDYCVVGICIPGVKINYIVVNGYVGRGEVESGVDVVKIGEGAINWNLVGI